ncbi:MAG: hypothetical protein IJA36_06060 [Lachnospiraceae bacterium]|nr:hypothetical protein [Lachnospiraceae bacterium]
MNKRLVKLMEKIWIRVLVGIPLVLLLLLLIVKFRMFVGCGPSTYQESISTNNQKDYGNGYFTTVTEWSDEYSQYYIVYANDTNVKYLIIEGRYQYGITPLYNADGTLQIYEEK